VWVLDKDGSVRRIDPVTNEAIVIRTVAKDPKAIAAGLGAAWVADGANRAVYKIDPASNHVVETVPTGEIAREVIVGDDAVWVAGDHILRLDPSSGDVSERGASLVSPPAPPLNIDSRFSISAGGGLIWETFSDYPKLARYVVATSDSRLLDLSVLPRDIAATGTDVWIAACGTPGTVVRLDAGTGEESASIPAGGSVCPYFTTRGEQISIAAGDADVWVTDAVNGSVSRIQQATNQVDTPIRIGDTPTAVAVGLGSVWVTIDGEVSPSPSTS
jgi:hypothetical protein